MPDIPFSLYARSRAIERGPLAVSQRVLVFGADGQVGRALRESPSANQTFIGCTRSQADITDGTAVNAVLADHDPAIVVNAAAYTEVDRAEQETDRAFAVNHAGASNVAEACARTSVPLIHLSTDFVFDGAKRAAYVETDSVNPLSVYGKSKAAGEKAVLAAHAQTVVLRTAWVYSPWRKNFLRTMLRLGSERDEVRVVDDQRGCPTAARDIAEAVLGIAAALPAAPSDMFGIFHFCGGGETSWYGFAEQIFICARQHDLPVPDRLIPIATAAYPTPAQRPATSVLSCEKIARIYGLVAPPWQDSVARCINEIAGQRS